MGIAQKLCGSADYWKEFYEVNSDRIGRGGTLTPGVRLRIPKIQVSNPSVPSQKPSTPEPPPVPEPPKSRSQSGPAPAPKPQPKPSKPEIEAGSEEGPDEPRRTHGSCGWELRVVGFHAKRLKLQVDDHIVRLSSGSWGYTIPPGSETRLLQGDALMLLDTIRITAHWGDRFSYFCNGEFAEVMVHEGALGVKSRRGGSERQLETGEFLMIPPLTFPEVEAQLIAKAPRQPILKILPLTFLVELHPYYQLQQTYDSNIYRVPRDQANGVTVGGGVLGSWITANSLGSAAKLLFSRSNSMEAAYGLNSLIYTTQPRANDALEHEATLAYKYEGPRGFKSKIFDKYVNATTPPTSELLARTRHFDNTIGVEGEISLARRTILEFDAAHTNYRFLDSTFAGFLDRYEQLFGMSAGILIQPRTKLFLAYHRLLVHYSAGRPDNSKSDLLDLGIDGRLLPKVTGRIQAGAQLRQYDADPTIGGANYDAAFQAQLQLQYKLDIRTKISIIVRRSIEEARLVGTRFYTSDSVDIAASRVFRRLTLGAELEYEKSSFSDPITVGTLTTRRMDNYYVGNVNMGYSFRPWLAMTASYTRSQRVSNFSSLFSMSDDLTTVGVKVQF